MTLDGTYGGTLDRITEGIAVILVEADDETLAERRVSDAGLPAEASAGDVCSLTFEDGTLVDIEVLPERTADRRQRLRERFDALSERLDEEREKDG
ncbi:MAG: hypothetical protein ACI9TI_000577 [Natronomonas sp.]|uniref:DUF3006 domain-containing protein n=1 Tax=Natronomonas sp. TaxID=2184060 RepID=UPI003989335E